MDLNKLAKDSYINAFDHGFYTQINELMCHQGLTDAQKQFIKMLWCGNRLMLIVSEIAEAHEGLRKNNFSSEPKSGGVGEEIADATIRIADFTMDIGLDWEKDIQLKADYNLSRPYMHDKSM